MSFIEESNLNYLSHVEQFFLSLKDSGLSLSAADYYLILNWENRGVPLKILCMAIEKGTRNYFKSARNGRISLTYLRDFIEKELSYR